MADFKTKYASSAAITCTLGSLATSSTRVAGRASAVVDNTTNLYLDALLSGVIKTGTSPTGGQIDIYIYADDGNDIYPDGHDGTDSTLTATSENVRNAEFALAKSILVDTNSNRSYYFRGISIASLFGNIMPRKWGVFITHNTGVNLNSSGHELRYQGAHVQSV